jgi:protein-tyrosine phosphatase
MHKFPSAEALPHEVFNWYNNSFPLLPIYMPDSPPQQRLRRSALWPPTSVAPWDHICAADLLSSTISLVCSLRKPSDSVMVVFFVENHLDCESGQATRLDQVVKLCAAMNTAPRESEQTTIVSLCAVNAKHFLSTYLSCGQLLFDDSPAPARRITVLASEIIPKFLFLGDFENGQDIHQLRALGITHIIDATNVRSSRESAEVCGLQYLPVDVDDREDADISKFFSTVNAFISSARDNKDDSKEGGGGHRVLVHCRAGWSRSPTLVMAYLVVCEKWSLGRAVATVLRARPFVCPNNGFIDQLCELGNAAAATVEEDVTVEESESSSLTAVAAGAGFPSARTRQEFISVVKANNVMWSSGASADTDLDRRPIRSRPREEIEAEIEKDGLMAAAGDPAAGIARKPFLKRGSRRQ